MIRYTKWAIWLYIFLLFFEGALRKWIVPSLSSPLLIVRDPVLLLIYVLALAAGVVPKGKFMALLGVLAALSFCFSFLAGQNNLFVTLFGLRTNYLHVPLIWVMAGVMTRKDVEHIGVFVLIFAVFMTGLMIIQFKSPIESWVNRGIGSDEGGQIYGAAGRIRPPGFFTFITGPMVFFPLATAFLLNLINTPKPGFWRVLLLIASGLAIAVALPISISRGTMIGTLFVLVVFAFCLFKVGVLNAAFLRFGAMGLFLVVGLSFLPIFNEGREVFMDRWNTAAAEVEGDAVGSLISRVAGAFTQPLDIARNAPVFGYGIGVGTNAGAAMLAGRLGFLLAEDEWGRVIMELGGLLGFCFIFYRIALVVHLGIVSLKALLNERDMLPLLILSASGWVILMNQWGQPTQLGFAVLGGGLILASLNRDDEEDDKEDDAGEWIDADSEDADESAEDDESDEIAKKISDHEARRRRMRGL